MSKRTRQKLAAAVYKTLSLSADWRPAFFEALEPRQLLSTANGLQQAAGYTAGNLPYAVVAGDFAKNGETDLAVVNSGSNNISILMGNGDGTFNTATNYSTGGSTPVAIAEADLNGDGYLDLVVANYASNTVAVFMNKGDGTGTFNNAVTYTVGSKPDAIGIADLNGDAKPDLVIANRLGNSVSVLLNTGTGTFGTQTTYSVGTTPYAVVTGTFGTANQSVAVANQGSNNVSVLLGNGNGTLQTKVNYATGNGPVAIAAADLTGAGTVSLVTANSTANSVSVLLGNNNGTFQNKVSYAVGTSPHAVAIADMNGDGTPDLVVANSGSDNISILDGSGTGTFGTAANSPAGTSPFGLATGDFNGDGRTDVAVADFSSSSDNVDVLLGKEIAGQGIDITATEGTGFTGDVATFTDTESGIAAGSYTANIDWGDGTTSVGSITATDSSFTISGSHTYDENGSSTVSVTITDPGGASTTASSLASINDATITATGATLTVTEGIGFTGQVVGSFTDGYSGAVAGQFTAFIDWGDGTTSEGTVVTNGGGGFNVEGDHTYAHAGQQSVFATISDDGGSSDTAISTINVQNATLTPTASPFSTVEGEVFTNEQVATFTDANTASINSDFTASINWGNGETTTGTVGGDAGTFTVDGTNSYTHAGTSVATITIVGLGGTTITTDTTATVDNAALTGTGTTITETEGSAFSTTTVATFTDANASAYDTDFTASIVWGDGNTSAGAVSGSDGTYTVTGGNTYLHAGTDTITITVTGLGGGTTSVNSTASVANAVLASTGTTLSEVEGSAFSGTAVATFTDANSSASSSDFTASIVWGDGNTSAGVVSGSNGTYTVKGANTYDDPGNDTITITVTGLGGGSTSVNSTATVADAALASTGTSITEVEGAAFTTTTVATFTDTNTLGSSSDFTASIVWGDGNTSAGVVTGSGGTYSVNGGNTYDHAGTDSITISVVAAGGDTLVIGSTATVDNATLTGTGTTISPTEGSAFTTLTVATFTDANASASSSDFTASIVWGDGNTSAGVVSGSDGTYTVTGGNTYLHAGSDTITVSITGFSGSTSATSTASVGNATLASTGTTIDEVEGASFSSTTVATFTDANASASSSDFTASIVWGDGNTSAGVVSGSNGTYTVKGANTYDDPGNDTITITVTGLGGGSTSVNSTATVADAALASTGTSITEVEGAAFTTTTVATFTDTNTLGSSSDFTASIVWGDGNTSAGVVTGSGGTYSVNGGNTYDHAGTDSITISVVAAGGDTLVIGSTATVDNATLTGTGTTISPTEGSAFTTLTVATFTDANASASSSDFTASIVWGDGNTSAGVVSGSDGTYTVTGGNTYLHAGSDTITVSITGFSGSTSATSTASVGNATLASTGTTIDEVEGASFSSTTVATFTDANASASSSDFTASIVWGDGNTSAGVVSGSNGTYTVKGANTYDDPGNDTITITVTGLGGGSTSVNSTATVADAALASTGTSITEVEGAAFTTTTVATFTDTNTLGSSSDFTASIVWGDGNTSAGVVTGSGGAYSVNGGNTYDHAGTDSITISVVAAGGDTLVIGSTATVDNATLTATGTTLTATEGSPFSDTLVATFTDANVLAGSSDFTASIIWGDGNTSAGAISGSDGTFTVSGGNTYDNFGADTVTVSIAGLGGGTATADSTATVADAPMSATSVTTGSPISFTEGVGSGNLIVAYFTDGNPGATSSDFTATINWGDGNSNAGTITTGGGGFEVIGSHTYLHAGSDTATISIADTGTSTAETTDSVTVANATLTGTGTTITKTEGTAFSGTAVATFTDVNASASSSDFTATINWGDGSSITTGTVTGSNGTYTVAGGHTYTDAGSDTITVSVAGLGGGTASATSTATVDNATLTGTAATLTSVAGASFTGAVVATFTDANASSSSSDFTASIVWGDGSTTSGSVLGSNGTFSVQGDHDYESFGTDHITVTVTGFSGTATINSTATVADAAITATGEDITGIEGTPLTGIVVANFTDTNGSATTSDFSALINWGDTHTTTGTIVSDGEGGFNVLGTHTYATTGSRGLGISVISTGGSLAVGVGSASISVGSLSATGSSPISEVEGASFSGTTLATFTDSNLSHVSNAFTASINWGDGTTSAGAVTGSTGTFSVTGGHTYAHAGSDNITVTLSGTDSGTATAGTSASVANAALASTGTTISETEGSAFSTTTVATFTDVNASASSSDFTASIVWGDGNTSAGAVSGSNGTYTVSGGDTYAHAGTDTLTVTVTGLGGGTTSVNSTATVDNATLTGTGTTISPTEGSAFTTLTVATFTDANASASSSDFTASIVWGDGNTSAGVVAGSNGTYTVTGGNTYLHAGSDTITVSITGFSGSTSATSTASVGNATLASTGKSLHRTEGIAVNNFAVATFTDANASASSSDFTASIVWGDGTTSAGAVSGSGGMYSVKGTHTYEDAGTDTITITVTGLGGGTTSVNSTATIANADLASTGTTITETEGSAFSTTTVATFTDINASASSSDFTASIVWGDGNTSAGVVSGSDGTYTVSGGDTYLHAGTDTITITVTGLGGGTTSVNSTATVDNATLTGTGTTISPTEGSAFTTLTVATFTDANASASSSDFTASIVWGDGNTSAGVVSGSDGTYTVTGGNTYLHAGSDTITVSITGFSGSTSATSTASVGNATLASTGTTIDEVEGASFSSTTVATFTDANASASSSDFTASIVWGDGNTSAGVVSGSNGTYTVKGANTYDDPGNDTITITVTGLGGGSTSVNSTATVADAALASTGTSITEVEGAAFTTTTVATFTDTNTLGSSSDFTASIVWGDGNTSAGVVTGSGGTYSVNGGNTYDHAGTDSITISVVAAGGDTLVIGSTATVDNATLTGTGTTISPTEGSAFTTLTVATFTDANASASSSDFTASIVWGDGNTSAGVVSGSDGTYTVTGGNTYLHAGSDTITVSITGFSGSTSATSTASVGNATLASTGTTIDEVEGASFSSTTVATFTDANASASSSDFTASIVWGDGNTSAGVVSGSDGTYTVSGGNTYLHAGTDTITITVTGFGGGTTSVNSTASVANAVLNSTGTTLSKVEGIPFSGTAVATFTDANSSASSSDFTASIVWGDGNTSAGVVSGSDGSYTVKGGDTYLHAGTDTITITVTGLGGGTTSVNSTATVANADLASTGTTITETEGSAFSTTTVATFTDINASASSSDFTASIVWGDGNTSAGVVSGSDGTYTVSGGDTYLHAGTDTITITVTGLGGGTTSVNSTATVDNATLTGTGTTISPTEGSAFSTTTVATFTDVNASASSSDFTASIVWGDGNTSAGVVAGSNGTYTVSGGNTYLHAGSDTITVSITGFSGSTSATSTASVANATLAGTAASFSTTEGIAFDDQLVGTFTDANASASSNDFTALIHWGNGQHSNGTVVDDEGTFEVLGSRAYAEAGTYTITVDVTGLGGGTTVINSTATVADAALTAGTGSSFTFNEGQNFNGIIATFTDAFTGSSPTDFTSSINWGDGIISTGTVTGSGGTYSVYGNHAYQLPGTNTVTVSINDVGGSTATVHDSVTDAAATLTAGSGSHLTSTEGVAYTGTVGTFTSSSPIATTDEFSATINWGDGNSSTGTVAASGSSFTVTGGHTYAVLGTKTVGISIVETSGNTISLSDTMTISDAPIVGTAANFSATALTAMASTSTLGTFSDANTLASAGSFTAAVNWGDGTSGAATVVALGGGNYAIRGGHTYAGPGHDMLTLTVSDAGGSTTLHSTATVAAAPISASGATLVTTAGTSFSGVVGNIVDPNPNTTISNYTVTITWADGGTSVGTIVKTSTGHYAVHGTHTYALGGSYAVGLSVVDNQGPTASATSRMTVNDAAITATAAPQLKVTRGTAFSGVLTTFTDANPLSSLTRVVNSVTMQNFTAMINWGDGTSSAGTITFSGGKYSVSGTHTYGGAATYAAVVSISEYGGATAMATTSVWARKPGVSSKPSAGSGQPLVNYNYRNHHHHNEARRRRLDAL